MSGGEALALELQGQALTTQELDECLSFVTKRDPALARVGLDQAFPTTDGRWPWITFVINVTGAFVLGALTTRVEKRPPSWPYWRALIGTGFCGAYTTFSTMQVEILEMLEHHRYGLAAGYATASIAAGYTAIWLATAIVRRVRVIA